MGTKLSTNYGNNKSIYINDLNDDIFYSIFSYFSYEELILLSDVCMSWKIIIERIFDAHKCLHFTPVIDLPFDDCCQSCLYKEKNQIIIKTNRIESYKPFVTNVISKASKLEKMNFVGLDFDDSTSPFRLLLDHCKSDIKHLNLTHLHNKRNFSDKRIAIHSKTMEDFVRKFPNIIHLNGFRSWFKFTDQSLIQLFSGLKNIEFISLAKESICVEEIHLQPAEQHISGHNIQNNISGDYFQFINPDIQVIRITQNILGENGLYHLGKRAQNLKELRINTINKINDLKIICQELKNLKILSFSFGIIGLEKYEAFELISSLNQLEYIDIVMTDESEENDLTSDQLLLKLMSNTQEIKTIIFKGNITDQSMQFVDQYWPKLEKLQIKSKLGSTITSNSITKIAKLKNLKYLDLSNYNINDNDVHKIIFAPNKLQFIDLSGTRITNKSLDFLIEKANSMPNQIIEFISRRTSVDFSNESNRMPYNLVTH